MGASSEENKGNESEVRPRRAGEAKGEEGNASDAAETAEELPEFGCPAGIRRGEGIRNSANTAAVGTFWKDGMEKD